MPMSFDLLEGQKLVKYPSRNPTREQIHCTTFLSSKTIRSEMSLTTTPLNLIQNIGARTYQPPPNPGSPAPETDFWRD